MTDHDPKAVDSLAAILDGEHVMQGFELGFVESAENRRIGSAQLDALADSGLAVVKVGEVPPWMVDAGCRDHLGEGPVLYDDEPCHEEPCTCRQLWMLNTEATDLLIADWGHLD
jgi:hypothetical protein